MEKEKQETLGMLYTLRAGLSMMSSIADNANVCEEQIEVAQQALEYAENSQNQVLKEQEECKSEYISNIEHKQSQLENLYKEEKSTNEAFIKERKKHKKIIVWCSVASPFLIWFPLLTIIAIGFAIAASSDLKDLKKRNAQTVAQQKIDINNLETEIQTLKNNQNDSFNKLDNNYSAVVKSVKDVRKSSNNLIKELKNTLSTEIKKFNDVYSVVSKQFNAFLDERDWENVDLIIYLYETGRAIDLRDALMQVDMERRNERLIDAILTATKAISYTIERGFGELKQTVEIKMNMLNSSIQDLSYAISEQTEKMDAQMGTMIDIASAQQALQEKLNTTSDAMAQDISYMKDLSHRTYYNV